MKVFLRKLTQIKTRKCRLNGIKHLRSSSMSMYHESFELASEATRDFKVLGACLMNLAKYRSLACLKYKEGSGIGYLDMRSASEIGDFQSNPCKDLRTRMYMVWNIPS